MNIKRAKQEIKDTIEAYLQKDEFGDYIIPRIRQRPVLMLGAPGIGKTQIMEQIAQECGIGLVAYTITHHTRQSAIGLPFISQKTYGGQEYAATEYTMSEIVASVYNKMEKTGLAEGILFIDEINCVSETLAPAMLQFLQCKMFGNHEIPKGWIIVAAGNPPEYNKSVREFDVVTMDRVKKIEVEPDFTVWKEYAIQCRMHPAVLSYLDTRTAYFYRMETTVDGRRFATPRGWEDLSQMLFMYEKLHKTMDREVIVQYIQHEKIAKDFANYLELYYKYQMDYQLEAVLEGTIDDILLKKAAHASFDERLSVTSLLLARCRQRFADYYFRSEVLELLYEPLKTLSVEQSMAPERSISELLAAAIERFEVKAEQLVREERMTRRMTRIYHTVQQTLESWQQEIRASKEQADFGLLRDWFGEMQDQLEQEAADAETMLEHAFDFIEAAYEANGQEMVLFVTELNSDLYTVRFLQENECERYYQYNKQLLFEEGKRSIENRIDAVSKK